MPRKKNRAGTDIRIVVTDVSEGPDSPDSPEVVAYDLGSNGLFGEAKMAQLSNFRKVQRRTDWKLDDDDDDDGPEGEELLKNVCERRSSIARMALEQCSRQEPGGAASSSVPRKTEKEAEGTTKDSITDAVGHSTPNDQMLGVTDFPPAAKLEYRFEERKDSFSMSSLKRNASSSILSAISNARQKFPKNVMETVQKRREDLALRLFVTFLLVVCIFLVALGHVLKNRRKNEFDVFENVVFNQDRGWIMFYRGHDDELETTTSSGQLLFVIRPGLKFAKFDHNDHHGDHGALKEPVKCIASNPDSTCLEWIKKARLEVSRSNQPNNITCYNYHWTTQTVSLMDCFLAEEPSEFRLPPHWYGGGDLGTYSKWPLDETSINESILLPSGTGRKTVWGNSIRRLFLNSNGVSVTIHDKTPVTVSVNANIVGTSEHRADLCIGTSKEEEIFSSVTAAETKRRYHTLNYTVCVGENIVSVHDRLLPPHFWDGHSREDLDTLHYLLEKPTWEFPTNLTMDTEEDPLVERVKEKMGFSTWLELPSEGFFLLGHDWQKHMGDYAFDEKRFPDVRKTINDFRDTGMRVALTVTPFVSVASPNFAVGVENNLFVLESGKSHQSVSVPALTTYKASGLVAMLDVTKNETIRWLTDQLYNLDTIVNERRLGSSGMTINDLFSGENFFAYKNVPDVAFYLETGSVEDYPAHYMFANPPDSPDIYRDMVAKLVSKVVPVIGISGASGIRPKAPAFVSLSPMESDWSSLKSMISDVLHLSSIGYPFINVGPIGGHNFEEKQTNSSDALELYIRWWALSIFMPTYQFSTPPSFFGDHINRIAKMLFATRSQLDLNHWANEAMDKSQPIIRPLWMFNPYDPISLKISDQFMIGDKVLVAPILEKGKLARDVYLPKMHHRTAGAGADKEEGAEDVEVVWRQMGQRRERFFKGGRWLKDAQVELDQVLYFVRQTEEDVLPGKRR